MSHIAMVLISSAILAWQGEDAKGPTPAAIEQAVKELGDDRYAVRERASQFLWKAGEAAEAAVREALDSNDPEVVARARRILYYFDYGIYPNTPESTVAMINQFRFGDRSARQSALEKLLGAGEAQVVLKLLRVERDANVRRLFAQTMARDAAKLIRPLLVAGEWARVESLLELAAGSDRGMRDYAAYLLLRNRLHETTASLKGRVASDGNSQDTRLLAYLLRAQGDLSGALATAEGADDSLLLRGLLFESGRWKQLAELYDRPQQQNAPTARRSIENLGYQAAFHRLAGNTEQFDNALGAIKDHVEDQPDEKWFCGEALMINGRFDEAVELFKKHSPRQAVELLAAQSRYREALQVAGIEDPQGPYLPWFAEEPPALTDDSQKQRFHLGLAVVGILGELGEKDQAAELFAALGKAAGTEDVDLVRALCKAGIEAGLKEDAARHALGVLGGESDSSVVASLFPKQSSLARVWWEFLGRQWPDAPAEKNLMRLRGLLDPSPDGETDAEETLRSADESQQSAEMPDRAKWLLALGETHLIHGNRDRARAAYQQAADLPDHGDASIRVGDLLAEDGLWEEAALWYRRARSDDPDSPLALYLEGRAMIQAGHEADGKRLVEVAELLPLGDARTRYYLAKGLDQRHLSNEARHMRKIAVRTGEFQSWAANEAARLMGNAVSGSDPFLASTYWQRPLLTCLKTSTSILGVKGYVELVHLVHKARARGLLEEGKVDEAIAEIRIAQAANPGQTKLAIDLAPKLEAAERPQAADRLFDEVHAVVEAVCRDFPRSASHHNNLAWMATCCNRRLDAALEHSSRAVELDPENPAYLDTLADIHFRRGDPDKAIELAERCIALSPDNPHFRRQLERFKAP